MLTWRWWIILALNLSDKVSVCVCVNAAEDDLSDYIIKRIKLPLSLKQGN